MTLMHDFLGRKRWRLFGWWQSFFSMTSREAAPIVIGGCGSSGTTLLRYMLNRHPEIACGAESTVFLPRISSIPVLAARSGLNPAKIENWQSRSRSQSEFIVRFQKGYLELTGKRYWADKTPENVMHFETIRRWFPKAKFVHVIRDGRDVACSLRTREWMKLRDRSSCNAIARCIAHWAERVERGRRLRGCPGYIEVRYEDLVADPEACLRRLLGGLGIEWSDQVLLTDHAAVERAAGKIEASSIGRWSTELSSSERAMIQKRAGALLIDLGYERNSGEAGDKARHKTNADIPVFKRAPKKWRRAERLGIELATLIAILGEPRVPWRARAAACCALTYLVWPLDFIPDWTPFFGYLDDVGVFGVAIAVLLMLTPRELIQELRGAAVRRFESRLTMPYAFPPSN